MGDTEKGALSDAAEDIAQALTAAISSVNQLAADSAAAGVAVQVWDAARATALQVVQAEVINEATSAAMEIFSDAYDAAVAERTQLAVLLIDPTLERTGRPSNWSFAFTADRGEKEAKVQLNVCDAIKCPERSVVSVTLVGPIEKNVPSTTLFNFDGLAGQSRVEVDASLGALGNASNRAGSGFMVSIRVRAAPTTFSFADPTTLAPDKLEETVWSLGASLGHRFGTIALLQVGYETQRGRKPGESQELCIPLMSPVAGATVCRNTPIGAPAEVDQQLVSLLLASRIGHFAGIRVEARHSSSSDNWFLDVPLYVIPNAAGELAGGVRLRHDFGTDETSVSLFVSLFKL